MAIWVLESKDKAVWVDSVTETAFGPLFDDGDEALSFETYHRDTYAVDPRLVSSEVLAKRLTDWRKKKGEGEERG